MSKELRIRTIHECIDYKNGITLSQVRARKNDLLKMDVF